MPTDPKPPDDPGGYSAPKVEETEPSLEVRITLLEEGIVRLYTRLEEVLTAQQELTQTLGGLTRLLRDISNLDDGSDDDDR